LFELATATFFGWDKPKPATIRTSELGFIHKGEDTESRITAFYSRLNDLVVLAFPSDPTKGFGNESATAQGVELEQRWRVNRQWTFDGNVSYVDTRGDETGKPFPGAAPWLANAGITYEKGNFLSALQAHYVSGYRRQPNDPRDTLSGYTTVDLTGTFALGPDGLQFRLGVKNLFDADVRYPAPIVQDVLTYSDDFPRAGRSGWAQLTYRY
jgi:iron complex outermembrane receptor protein